MSSESTFNSQLWEQAIQKVTGTSCGTHCRIGKQHPKYPEVLEAYRVLVRISKNPYGVDPGPFDIESWQRAVGIILGEDRANEKVNKSHPDYPAVKDLFLILHSRKQEQAFPADEPSGAFPFSDKKE